MNNIEAIYPLSPMQQGMLYHTLSSPKSDVYINQIRYLTEDRLNISAFQQAWQIIIMRHPILRTAFVWEELDEPLQVVGQNAELTWSFLDLVELPENTKTQYLEELCRRMRRVDMNEAPLIRCAFIRLAGDSTQFIWTLHHIIMDGWSTLIIQNELIACYRSICRGQNWIAPEIPHYGDYIAWLQQQDLSTAEAFWREYLKDLKQPSLLDLNGPDVAGSDSEDHYEREQMDLSPELSTSLNKFIRRHHLTLSTFIQGLWSILLSRYSGKNDVLFGTTISDRPPQIAGIESIVGLFINTLPIRVRINDKAPLLAWFRKLQAQMSNLLQYGYTPLSKIRKWCDIPRALALFETILVFEGYSPEEVQGIDIDNWVIQKIDAFDRNSFPMTVFIIPGSQLSLLMIYDCKRFSMEGVKYMRERVIALMENIIARPEALLGDLQIEVTQDFPKLSPRPKNQHRIPLSYHQERLWFIDKFETGSIYDSSPVYHNMPLVFNIDGSVYSDLLKQALGTVISRHTALHTRIMNQDGKVFQIPESNYTITIKIIDLISMSDERMFKDWMDLVKQEALAPFTLEGNLLVRAVLLQMPEHKSIFIVTLHHIIADRWTLRVVTKELSHIYTIYASGLPLDLPDPVFQYSDYVQWQRELSDSILEPMLFYWRRQLCGQLSPIILPTERPRPAVHTFTGAYYCFRLDEELAHKIRISALKCRTSEFVLLLSVFKVLLHIYSQNKDIVVGTIIPCRNESGMDTLVGPVSNLIALRSTLKSDLKFESLLGKVSMVVHQALKNQDMPFDKLVEKLKPEKDMSRTALFDILFQFDEHQPSSFVLGSARAYTVETNLGHGKYDLNFLLYRDNEAISAIVVFNSDIYGSDLVEQMFRHYQSILSSLLSDSRQQLCDIDFLSREEKLQQMILWNSTSSVYPKEETIHGLFEKQVGWRPDATALIFEEEYITYMELNQRANQLAWILRDLGVEPDTLVSVALDRKPEMIVTLLGVLKSGAAYLPIDSESPASRILSVLDDSGTRVVITQDSLTNNIPFTHLQHLQDINEQLCITKLRTQRKDLDTLTFPDRTLLDTVFPAVREKQLSLILLDLSQHFSYEAEKVYNVIEAPLGLMYLLTYLNEQLGQKICGTILKSRVDFDSFEELRERIISWKPHVIGIRTLPSLKDFLHKTASLIKLWFPDICIIAEGPYAMNEYTTALSDENIDIAIIGEEETTFTDLIGKILDTNGTLPTDEVLGQIDGLAFVPRNRLCRSRTRKILILDQMKDKIAQQVSEAPLSVNDAHNLIYCIYTSGSTGDPKGVLLEHRNVVRLLVNRDIPYCFSENDVWLLCHSYCFDVSVWEMYGALIYGGMLIIVPQKTIREPSLLADLLVYQQVTVLNQTPLSFCAFATYVLPQKIRLPALRYVVFAGDKLDPSALKEWTKLYRHIVFVNMYGITETTVHVTFKKLVCSDIRDNISAIGRPLPTTTVYLINSNLQLLPQGVSGEIYVGGEGVARGYLGRSDLTAERFLPSLIEKGERMYRSGDLARFLPNGAMVYIGRLDSQVKIRGYRVELGEVESALGEHPLVRDVVVLLRQDDNENKRLIGYVVPLRNRVLSVSELHRFLKEKLPDYMIPSTFVLLDSLPMTVNGKVDRKALPAPEGFRPQLHQGYVSPQTQIEQTLVEIWSDILRIKPIGIHDNFFELGGDSILSIQISAKANQAGLRLTSKQLFQHQTIAGLANEVQMHLPVQSNQGTVTGSVPLTPIQHWFFQRSLKVPEHFNQSFMLELSPLENSSVLEQIFTELLRHHDALRMSFSWDGSSWKQQNKPMVQDIPFDVVDLSVPFVPLEDIWTKVCDSIQASLDLKDGPLARGVLLIPELGKSMCLLIVIHHLVVDGVSWRILFEDLEAAYYQITSGEALCLPPKTSSFKSWTEALLKYGQSEQLLDELDHWLSFANRDLVCLPVDYVGTTNTAASLATYEVSLKDAETLSLLREVHIVYNTQMNDILLTALVRAFYNWTGHSCLYVDLEGHGREELFGTLDVSRTVGWFTSLYPVYLQLPDTGGSSEALKSIKEQLRSIPHRGIGYGILRYLSSRQETSALCSIQPPEVIFNYLGQFEQQSSLSVPFRLFWGAGGAEQSCHNDRSHSLSLNAYVFGEQLHLNWSYSTNIYKLSTIESLAQTYLEALRSLVRHCQSVDSGDYTPSDFPTAQLDDRKLEEIMQQIEFESYLNE